MEFFSRVRSEIDDAEMIYGLHPRGKAVLMHSPFLLLLACSLLLVHPSSRPLMLWLLEENHPVEILTFLFLLAGGVAGGFLALRCRKGGAYPGIWGFYLVFSFFLFVTAMEEIAWGQWLLGFQTPEALKDINAQGETTLHNLGSLQGKSEWFRLVFGLGGLIGIRLSSLPSFRAIGAPALLLPWFIVITGHAAVDVFNDFIPIQKQVDYFIQRSSELIELLIGMSGFLYIWLNARRLAVSLGAQ